MSTYIGQSNQLAASSAGSATADLAKAHGFLTDAIIRIQQHLGTLGTTAFEHHEAGVLLSRLAELRAEQQNYQTQIVLAGAVP